MMEDKDFAAVWTAVVHVEATPRRLTQVASALESSSFTLSHSEHTEIRLRIRRVEGRGDSQPEHHAGVDGIYDAVVPKSSGAVVRASLAVVTIDDWSLEFLLLSRRHRLSALN